jgi:putative intracellular protease/amidase
VWVVLPERVLLLDIAGPMEVLRRANIEQQALKFNVRYVGSSPGVTSSVGIPLADIAPLPVTLSDKAMIIVPGAAGKIAFAEDASQAAVRQDERRVAGRQSGTAGWVFLHDSSRRIRSTRRVGAAGKGLG